MIPTFADSETVSLEHHRNLVCMSDEGEDAYGPHLTVSDPEFLAPIIRTNLLFVLELIISIQDSKANDIPFDDNQG